jgi:K+/H+ antiporter YhaU regulatory subunit KhtT
MSTRDAVNILDSLDQLKRSIDNCHPQVPSLAIETALIIEKSNVDEFFIDKSIDDLNKLTKQFEQNCTCESIGLPIRKRLEKTL